MASVFQAAKDHEFWTFTEGAYAYVFNPCEECRRRGMTCECPDHIRERKDGKKHVPCFYNGRKLATVWTHLEVEKRCH